MINERIRLCRAAELELNVLCVTREDGGQLLHGFVKHGAAWTLQASVWTLVLLLS